MGPFGVEPEQERPEDVGGDALAEHPSRVLSD
jgi:hypothetical protein